MLTARERSGAAVADDRVEPVEVEKHDEFVLFAIGRGPAPTVLAPLGLVGEGGQGGLRAANQPLQAAKP